MKRQFLLIVAVVLMILPGCASTGSSKYGARQKVVVDQEYVNKVEAISLRRRTQVTWINPATKRVANEPETLD